MGVSITSTPEALGHTLPPSLPTAPLRACLSDYLRSATASLPIKLFEARCWLTPPPEESVGGGSSNGPSWEPPFITIAFAQSVELVGAAQSTSTGTVDQPTVGGGVSAAGVALTVAYKHIRWRTRAGSLTRRHRR